MDTADCVAILEILLLLFVIWLLLYKRNSRTYSVKTMDKTLAKYKPEALVSDTDLNHHLLKIRLIQSKVGKRVVVDGWDCLNLATHNYLGLLDDGQIAEDACKTLRKYGVGSCGPRGFYGTMDVHLELEKRLANFMKMEESVVYSYGFSTIASAIPAYSRRGDIIFADEAVNFAIQKGLDASRSKVYFFKHNDIKDLKQLLIEQKKRDEMNPNEGAKTRRFLVTEGIYLNTGEICPLRELVALSSAYKLRLFLDESVSFGTLGENGRGVTEHFNINPTEIDLISAGLESAVPSIGGFCVGSHYVVEHQRLSGLGYCFSASLPPLLAQCAISALKRFEQDPQIFAELKQISALINSKFSKLSKLKLQGNETSPIKHLYIAEDRKDPLVEHKLLMEISSKCISRGIAIVPACYLYTKEKKAARPSIRISANRLLTESEIDQAFQVIDSVAKNVL